ncbi:MAG: hypothetical protein HKM93_16490 [Desulfobacteraceae bacterium]|nr:hypothetical protein [Desulfobacteraceae bacterium]
MKDRAPATIELSAENNFSTTRTINRRSFLRQTVLGVTTMAALPIVDALSPTRVSAAEFRRGGILRIASPVTTWKDPAANTDPAVANQIRQIAEGLTRLDASNTVRPWLLENWKRDNLGRRWTLTLRKNIWFNNGDPLTSEDVVFTLKHWLALPFDAPLRQLFEPYLSVDGIEKVDAHQVRLHLKRPHADVVAYTALPSAVILNHRTFEGDFLKNPHGTGPYRLAYFRSGERCVVKRRTEYWQIGKDQRPLPYLDQVEFVDMGLTGTDKVEALTSGAVDLVNPGDTSLEHLFPDLKADPQVQTYSVASAGTCLLRMIADRAPWRDNRVRLALKLCQHRQKILAETCFNEGTLGQDSHISSVYPEYCYRPTPNYQPERARALLSMAGFDKGLDTHLHLKTDQHAAKRYAEILAQDAAIADFRIQIHVADQAEAAYNTGLLDLEIEEFPHLPGVTTAMNLAYGTTIGDMPAPGNHSRWVDGDFTETLAMADAMLETTDRRERLCRLEDIMQRRGPVGIAFWKNAYGYATHRLQGFEIVPDSSLNLESVWLFV